MWLETDAPCFSASKAAGAAHKSRVWSQFINDAGQGILRITFDHPKSKNAVDNQMYVDLAICMEQAKMRDDIKCVVITNAGDFFSSGADLDATGPLFDMAKSGVNHIHHQASRAYFAILDSPKLVVGVPNGPAMGVGCAMLALCDIVYCSDQAWFQTPFFKWSIVPIAGSSVTFPMKMGHSRAAEMLLMNKRMNAGEAKACGFVADIYPSHELLKRVESNLAATVLKGPMSSKSIRIFKQLIKKPYADELTLAIRREEDLQGQRMLDEDHIDPGPAREKLKSKL